MQHRWLVFSILTLTGCGSLVLRGQGPDLQIRASGTLPSLAVNAQAQGAASGVAVVEHGDPSAPEIVDPSGVEVNASLSVNAGGESPAPEHGRSTTNETAGGGAIALGGGAASGATEGHGSQGTTWSANGSGGGSGWSDGSSNATASANGSATWSGGSSTSASGSTEIVFPGSGGAGEAAVSTGARGVMAISARGNPTRRIRPTLTALLGAGLSVEGHRVQLDDIGPLRIEATAAEGTVVADPSLTVSAEVVPLDINGASDEAHVVIRARGQGTPTTSRAPLSVHLVLDRSSSMQSSWHEVVAAARLLIETLQPSDTIQIVAYGSRGVEVLAPTRVGDGRHPLSALTHIDVGGGTNIEAGLRIAYTAAARRQRGSRCAVILVSDGVPTRGYFEANELGGLAAEARAQGRITTTTIGLGHQFDAGLLRAVASSGRGGYHVARDAATLAPTLRAELEAIEVAAVADLDISLRFPRGVQLIEVVSGAGSVEQRAGALHLTAPDLGVGAERRLVARVRISSQARKVADVGVTYRQPGQALQRARREIHASTTSPHADIVAIEAHLAASLQAAADALLSGDKAGAVGALEAHVAHVGSLSVTPAPVHHRTEAVARVGVAVDTLFDRADHRQRRELAHAMASLSFRLGL